MSTLRVDNLRGQTADGTNRYIVQVIQNTPTTTTHITLAQSPPTMSEVSTTMRTSITPNFASSLLRLNFQCLIGGRNSSAIMGIKFFDITNSSNVGFSSLGTGSSRTFVNASVRTKDHDNNDRHHLNMTAYQPASTTNSRTYGIFAYKESGETMDFNMTPTDNSGCSYAPPIFTIEEIAQ